ncbi:MAG: energy transducer TonB [Acidobacteria bacterium]|nr:energy transducer TonB [Acidobacteriota bacterium]
MLAALAPPAVRGEDAAGQAPKGGEALSFTLNVRIFEGVTAGAEEPARAVTSSYLKHTVFHNFDDERDLQAEMKIKDLYKLEAVRLLAQAKLVWDKGGSNKAVYTFRLNGREYTLAVTPGRLPERNRFRIEVVEKGGEKAFTLPDKNLAVFGFEDTRHKPYFITLRVEQWSDGAAAAPAVRPVSEGPVRVQQPKLVREVQPVYPEEARKATYGRVASIKVLRGVPLLDQAAIEALKQWVYEPMVIDGKPRPVVFTVTMRFRLDDKKKPKVEGAVEGGVAGGVAGGVQGGVQGGVEGGVEGAKPDPEFEKGAVRATGAVKPPKLVKQVAPVYPETARQARVEGVVILEARADEKGDVVDARVLRSVPALDKAALAAVKQWKYEPMVIDGKPRPVVFTVTIRFALDEGSAKTALAKFAAGAVRAEGDIQPPKAVKEVMPVYPEAARSSGVQGTVILGVKIDGTGRVVDAVVLRSVPLLDQAAIDAIRQWEFEPFVQDGKAVPLVFTQTVRFVLQ